MTLTIHRNPGDPGLSGDVNTIVAAVNTVETAAATAQTAATAASTTASAKMDRDLPWIDMSAHGVDAANTYTANQAALVALFAAAPTTGALYYVGKGGIIDIDGGIDIPPSCGIRMRAPTGRYWLYNATTMPPSPSAFRIRAGSTATYAFRFADNFGGDSARDATANFLEDFTLLGNNVGTMDGLLFSATTLESNFRGRNVRIVGMGGNGISTGSAGKMWAQEWNGTYIGGCGGYGLNVSGSSQIVDVKMVGGFITGNIKGGVNVDSTGASGQFEMHQMRVERSNYNPATDSAISASWYGAPGLRIRGNLQNSTFNISTDANSGPGVSIVRVSGRSIHDLKIAGLMSRDGWYDMSTGGSTNPQPGIEIVGYSGGSVDFIDLTGLKVVGGFAKDDGTAPSYYHPLVGAKFDGASFVVWPDIQIDSGIATPYSIGSLDLYRSHLAGRAGNTALATLPVYTGTSDRPGATGKGAAVEGMHGVDLTLGKPIWRINGQWRDATGTIV